MGQVSELSRWQFEAFVNYIEYFPFCFWLISFLSCHDSITRRIGNVPEKSRYTTHDNTDRNRIRPTAMARVLPTYLSGDVFIKMRAFFMEEWREREKCHESTAYETTVSTSYQIVAIIDRFSSLTSPIINNWGENIEKQIFVPSFSQNIYMRSLIYCESLSIWVMC